jgi:hypothetical protein
MCQACEPGLVARRWLAWRSTAVPRRLTRAGKAAVALTPVAANKHGPAALRCLKGVASAFLSICTVACLAWPGQAAGDRQAAPERGDPSAEAKNLLKDQPDSGPAWGVLLASGDLAGADQTGRALRVWPTLQWPRSGSVAQGQAHLVVSRYAELPDALQQAAPGTQVAQALGISARKKTPTSGWPP